MTKQEDQPADEDPGIIVPFGEEGEKLWRDQLKEALGMRELTRQLLAGVDPEEAYKAALAISKNEGGETPASPTPDGEQP